MQVTAVVIKTFPMAKIRNALPAIQIHNYDVAFYHVMTQHWRMASMHTFLYSEESEGKVHSLLPFLPLTPTGHRYVQALETHHSSHFKVNPFLTHLHEVLQLTIYISIPGETLYMWKD